MRRLWLSVVMACVGACVRTQPVEARPTARIAPAEQWVEQGSLVSWLGIAEATRAPEFLWRVVARPAGVADLHARGADAELWPDAPGEWRIELVLRDGEALSAPATASVHVAAPRDGGAPLFDAGIDAGDVDAGRFDADAGAVDAGSGDAGHVDAGGAWFGDVLDAGAIYLAGTLSEGACYRDALADILSPDVASTGFDCYFDSASAMVRPTDGVMLYLNTFEGLLREYHCDACRYSGVYPSNVLANDTILPTPCPANDELVGFLVSASGEVLHRCYLSSSSWRDSSGAEVFANTSTVTLLALGADGWAFSRSRLINWKTSTSTLIAGLPATPRILALRWSPPDGFLVALADANGEAGDLWRVDLSGVASRVGSYGARPPSTGGVGTPQLDSAGRLFARGRDTTQSFVDLVVRYEVGQPSRVIYTEATDPLVKLHISSLVTGP